MPIKLGTSLIFIYSYVSFPPDKYLFLFVVRLTSWWFTTFMAPAIKQKIHNVYAVTELDAHIKSTQFDIPMFIQEYDMSLHGLRFYQP